MILYSLGWGWKVNFSVEWKIWKSEKAHFLELQLQQAISLTLYEPGPSELAYLTRYNQYLTIVH